jgi:hypothetical protein
LVLIWSDISWRVGRKSRGHVFSPTDGIYKWQLKCHHYSPPRSPRGPGWDRGVGLNSYWTSIRGLTKLAQAVCVCVVLYVFPLLTQLHPSLTHICRFTHITRSIVSKLSLSKKNCLFCKNASLFSTCSYNCFFF